MEEYKVLMAWSIGWPEIVVVLVIALLIFGKKLPEAAKNLGKGFKEFKKAMKDTESEVKDSLEEDDNKK
jgi:sec-independent protein translocase protein TatA